jgi:hypothetical protein
MPDVERPIIDGPRGIRPIELGELMDFQNLVFRHLGGHKPTMGTEVPHLYSEANADNLRIIRQDGRIVSAVCVYPAHIQWGDAILKIGGIGGVCTHPDARKNGYAGMLLDDCIRLMGEQDYDLSVLWPGPKDWYRRYGWEFGGTQWKYALDTTTLGYMPEPPEGEVLTDPTRSEVIQGIQTLHEKAACGVVRDLALTKVMLNIRANWRTKLLVRDGEPVAYIVHGKNDGLSVMDFGGDPFAVLGLLRMACEQQGARYTHLTIPDEPDGVAAILDKLGFLKEPGYVGEILTLRPDHVLSAYGIDDVDVQSDADGWSVTYAGETKLYSRTEITKWLMGPERQPDKHVHPRLPVPTYFTPLDHM